MKKHFAALAIAVIAVGSGMPANAAANTVVAFPGSAVAGEYATPAVVLTQAAPATFVNLDSFAPHDVVSVRRGPNNQPLFRSGIISGGATSAITFNGTLAAGAYEFTCSLHSNMTGTAAIA